ncbi:MAG: ABC transporter permease subunit [Thermoanaerobacterales bacterium]|nr:ABC transporter permease subunit [Bacillota bacterium]MDI6907987.1 ABC transporter permease subunit [Thermoanaerobacterales bacterium]
MSFTALWPNKTLLWKEWMNTSTITAFFVGFITYISSYTLFNEIMLFREMAARDISASGGAYLHFTTADLVWFNRAFEALGSVLFVIALAAVMVGQERDRKTFDLLLAMPYSRREVIYNKFLFGFGLLLAVFVLNALIMTVLIAVNPGIVPFDPARVWEWALRNVLVLGFVFAFTMFISSMSGTTLGNGLLALIFLFFPVGITALIAFNMDAVFHLYTNELVNLLWEIGQRLTVPAYILGIGYYEDDNLMYVYGLVILATWVLYKLTQYLFARNQMENNGEVLMFGRMEGFFKLGVAVCFALLIGPMVMHRWNPGVFTAIVVYLLVGGAFWLLVSGIINWRKKH